MMRELCLLASDLMKEDVMFRVIVEERCIAEQPRQMQPAGEMEDKRNDCGSCLARL
jgi:hypothetical protein